MAELGIGDREVHLWLTVPERVRDPAVLARYRELASAEERARVDRFHFAEDRHLWLVARATVRTVLARYTGAAPAELRFRIEEHGRPELVLDGAEDLRFNLSHTPGLVACAVTRSRDVGVDVESAARGTDLAVARRFFAAREVAALEALDPSLQRDRFFDFWTLKESYIKARGLGLRLPLDGFAFDVGADGTLGFDTEARLEDPADAWWFLLLRPTPTHRAALALRVARPEAVRWSVRTCVPLVDDAPAEPEVLAASRSS